MPPIASRPTPPSTAPGAAAGSPASARRRDPFARRALRHPSFVVGAALVLALVGAALLSLVWSPLDPAAIDIANKLAPPGAGHRLGTDSLGRDIASQLLVASRTSLAAGVLAVAIGFVAGVALGALAAARPGPVDALVMRAADLTFAFPALLCALLLAATFGPGLVTSIVAIGIFNVPVFARVTHGAARVVWTRDFVLAARAAGKTRGRITLEHVLPNVAGALIVQATLQFAIAILAEAALAYLGLGSQPPEPSWGRMLAEAQAQLFAAPLLSVWPGAAIALSVLGLNLLGDGLRDLLDPRLSRRQ